MKHILALDTSTDQGSLALCAVLPGTLLPIVVGERTYRVDRGHAEQLLPELDDLFRQVDLRPASIALVAVGTGPGSFGGVRTGLSTAKALALAAGAPLFGHNGLAVLASTATRAGVGPILSILDARRGEVFVALYEAESPCNALREPFLLPLTDLPAWLATLPPSTCLVGQGAALLAPSAHGWDSSAAEFPSAAALATLAWASWSAGTLQPAEAVQPVYVRAPNATLPPSPLPLERKLSSISEPARLESRRMEDPRPSERERLMNRYGRKFAAGEVIFREGEPGAEAFLLQQGRVRLLKRVRAVERSLLVLRPGELFGEAALLPGTVRSSTAVALSEGAALAVDQSTFHHLLDSNPGVASRMVHQLVRRLRDAEDQIELMLLQEPQSKIVAALIKTAQQTTAAEQTRSEGPVLVAVSPLELSTRVGLDIDVVKRTVQRLREGNYLRVVDERLEIPDLEALRRLYTLLGAKDQVRGQELETSLGPRSEDDSARSGRL